MRDDFTEFDLPPEVLAAYPPSKDGLFKAVCPLVTNEMLHTMSEFDYGHTIDEHFQAMVQIRDSASVDEYLPWEPHEVLALTKWMTLHPVDDWPASKQREYHLMRLFGCTSLLESKDDVPGDSGFSGLCESAVGLGDPFAHLAGCMITHYYLEAKPWDREASRIAFGLLCVTALDQANQELSDLTVLLTELVLKLEKAGFEWIGIPKWKGKPERNGNSFLSFEREVFDQPWKNLAKRIAANPNQNPELIDLTNRMASD